MGYIDPKRHVVGDSIALNPEESSYYHDWSLEKRLYDYGYYKQDQYFPNVMDYLNAPADLIELINLRVTKGREDRFRDENRNGRTSGLDVALEKEMKEITKGF